ncbi:MAG: NCS2 family permease [Limnochordia bacterium]|nr:NCS2 family permease [Limnochordia bacterium]
MSTRNSTAQPSRDWVERQFKLKENKTNVRTEVMAGITTFMTMAYILFVNPSILSETGMPFDAVLMATAFSAVLATLLMAFLANYPFALAPGMGLNAYFTYSVVFGMGYTWETALGAVFISGVVFIVLSLSGIREMIIEAVPATLKSAISAGIGLFIAFIGVQNAGLVVVDPATMVALGSFHEPATILAALGILITGILLARNIKGALLWGILITTIIGIPMGVTQMPTGFMQIPRFATWAPVFGKLDIRGALGLGLLEVVFAFLFVDMFDTIGTLIGVSQNAGFLDKNGRLPRASRALLADSLGTVAGAVFGTPTVTTYVESAAGVAVGGRTGLSNVITAGCFLLSLFFLPIIGVVPAAATAPALIVVGAMMLKPVVNINWGSMDEALPAFIAIAAMPFTYSIATGIALGFVVYPIIKFASGKGKEVHWLTYVLGALFVVRFIYLG